MKFTLNAAGFVLIALALGLFVFTGYEMSLIASDVYTSHERDAIEPILGTALGAAVAMTFAGLTLRRLAKRRRWRWR